MVFFIHNRRCRRNEISSEFILLKLGIGTCRSRRRNSGCVSSSGKYYCDFAVRFIDCNRMLYLFIRSTTKILKGGYFMKIVVYKPPSFLKGLIKLIFRVKD